MKEQWNIAALNFFQSLHDSQSARARSVPGGSFTLYGTCYATLGEVYLDPGKALLESTRRFIIGCQDAETGLMIGPELKDFKAAPGVMHDREHLLLHLTCAAIPVCLQFGIQLPYPIRDAHRFCNATYLQDWLDKRNLKQAWFEGNNILFVGQLLVYLRDAEKHPLAQRALDLWFHWLDEYADPKTNLWGTDGHCSPMEEVYGGYHQLLIYHHENHPIQNPQGLADTVLSLQHMDGGFNPGGNGGACEDVDCVDILVNLYKRNDYRRPEIRCALRRCLRHILVLQNPDGGFPYNRDCPQSHMGIPGTDAAPNQSTTFATWFRVHTLALVAEILTDETELQFNFRFTKNLSMGWHQPWDKNQHQLTRSDRQAEKRFESAWTRRMVVRRIKNYCAPRIDLRRLASRFKKVVLR